jgi:hypothetical protein
MARWKPQADVPIGAKEQVGRRLFDEPMLIGAADQPRYDGLDLRNFQETRDNEYSLDRLGKTGIDGAVVRYLKLRAIESGKSFQKPKRFNGWITVKAEALTTPPNGRPIQLVASPVIGSGLQENDFHAHAIRPADQEDLMFALYLRHRFSGGKIEKSDAAARDAPTPLLKDWVIKIVSLLKWLVQKAMALTGL